MRSWNKPQGHAFLATAMVMAMGLSCMHAGWAQQPKPAPTPKATPTASGPGPLPAQAPAKSTSPATTPAHTASASTAALPAVVNDDTGDALIDALTCRSDNVALPGLLSRLRRERPDDFTQTDRQYANPAMDLYRLEYPVQAWGHASDAIVITENRVLMVVPGPVDAATKRLEERLADSAAQPLSGALDDQHALVLYEEQRPGLQQQVLIGCEYRLQGLSLLDNPEDLWRVPSNIAVP
jgi:hypothetical protein